MITTVLFHKLKSLLLVVVNVFRRALCCFRKRKASFCDSEPLTHVVSAQDNDTGNPQNWANEWGEDPFQNRPKTVQDHINLYRQQHTVKQKNPKIDDLEVPLAEENLFEDMTPKITRQTKVLIAKEEDNYGKNMQNRLNLLPDNLNFMTSAELQEWQDTTGWEDDSIEKDAQQLLREQKRLEQQRKAWEQQQKRLEKSSRSLGSRVGV